MRIGIIGAMHEEIIELKHEMKIEEEKNIGSFSFFIGELRDKKIVLVESGIGKVNSAVCATILLEVFKVKEVYFTGVAGAVGRTLNIGDIVVSSSLIEHD
ncbi:MAG: 5'-methylthioadenosine/S-adenosylhomocysteine nucleosidase, partial [Fusobacteriaceae bacterium]